MPDRASLLVPAVEAARQALRRLDDDELSPRLARVAASSARRLPPPLAKTLLDELDDSPWLRQRALDEWTAEGEGVEIEASELFLRRPEGWEGRLAELSSSREMAEREQRIADLERERERLQRQVDELTGELRAAREETQRAVRAAAADAGEEADRLRERVAELRARVERVEEERRAEQAAAARTAEELAEADVRISELRDALGRARRSGASGTGRRGDDVRVFGRGSPADTARALDQLRESLEAGTQRREERRPPEPLSLPDGTRPDRAEAVTWLLGSHRAVTLVVDGYNLAFALVSDPDATTRERVAAELARVRRLADAPIRPVVVWDSDREQASHTVGGVEVRFVPSADEEVVASAGPDTVVVSSDREVRERSEARGAVGLWSTALAEWLKGPSG